MKGFSHARMPTLEELAALPIEEVKRFEPWLNSPAALIIGANPLHGRRRKLIEYSELAKRILKREKEAYCSLGQNLIQKIYPTMLAEFEKVHITDYHQKHLFIIEQLKSLYGLAKKNEELEKMCDMQNLRKLEIGESRALSDRKSQYAQKLTESGVDLLCYKRKQLGLKEPFLVFAKRKTPIRIAHKIPYKAIESFYESRKDRKYFTEQVRLDDVEIGDVYAFQIVVFSTDEAERLTEEIQKYKPIEKLKVEDHLKNSRCRYQPYRAVHFKVAWNPVRIVNYRDYIYPPKYEIIIISMDEFFKANLGNNNHYRRMIAQQKGVVSERATESGVLMKTDFNDAEQQWYTKTAQRILDIVPVTYGREVLRPFSGRLK